MASNTNNTLQKQKNKIAQLLAKGQLDRAAKVNSALCKKFPRNTECWLNLGTIHGMRGAMEEAENCFRHAAQIKPDSAQAYFNLGIAQANQKKYNNAIESYQRVLALDPGHAEASCNLGTIFLHLRNIQAAFSYQLRASELAPDNAKIQCNLAIAYEELLEPLNAIACLRKAIELEPASTDAKIHAGFILERLNKLDEAEQYAKEARQREPNNARANILHARVLRRQGKLDTALDRLKVAMATGTLNSTDSANAYHEFGTVLDKQGLHDKAFDAFSECNRISASISENPSEAFLSDINAIHKWVETKDKLQSPLVITEPETEADHIFLVGFPRSGTTLLEQILSAHSKIVTTDERAVLNDVVTQILIPRSKGKPYPEYFTEASHETLELCRKWYRVRARKYSGENLYGRTLVDKLPFNLIHLDLIQYLFPDSKILVALRDPRDVVLSCFIQQFQLNEAMSNFTSLKSTVDLYIEVMQLWLKYKNRISLAYKEVRYENLVTDFESLTPEIFSFLDLPWEESIANFHERAQKRYISTPSYQAVGTPLYKTSAGRWKRYENKLGHEIKRLAPLLEEFGYSL